ncbi:phosphoribosylglycinamide formyltransferase [Algicola sagamiensis]|uniref:phosphoribosylglycinamide formyltransferase n=1 Tax=Algicola sagamiensis TaxID=163869 RepID=UPI00037AA772|nr:phosphoribosylglycinamide formyltransferase [Algicola sagamiensis]
MNSSLPKTVVLISGSGSNLQAIIDQANTGQIKANIVGVISNRPDAYGLERAKLAGIPACIVDHKAYDTREAFDAALAATIEQYEADILVLAGFMRILTSGFVQTYMGKMLNIHPSLLPKYTGLNTHQRAIDAKDSVHGVSVHFVTEELDGGPVILQAKVPIFPEDTADILAERVHEQEHRVYPLVLEWMSTGRLKMEKGTAWLDGQPLSQHGYANEDEEDIQ